MKELRLDQAVVAKGGTAEIEVFYAWNPKHGQDTRKQGGNHIEFALWPGTFAVAIVDNTGNRPSENYQSGKIYKTSPGMIKDFILNEVIPQLEQKEKEHESCMESQEQ